MARYFFHQHEHGFEVLDEEASLFADDAAALEGARHATRELAGTAVQEGEEIDGQRVEVVDEAGRSIGLLYWQRRFFFAASVRAGQPRKTCIHRIPLELSRLR